MDMQTEKPLSKEQPRTMSFSVVGAHLYQLHPEANQLDILSQLQTRLAQLNSMLTQTVGNGEETFNNWSDEIISNHLWACQMHAKECLDLAGYIDLSGK